MGFAENFAAMGSAMSQTDDERIAGTLRQMKQYRRGVIESLETLAGEMKQNRARRERYLAANGIDIEELQHLRAACDKLARELRWIG